LEAGRLGAVLMQFPWSFRNTDENREYVARLRQRFAEYPLVLEQANNTYLTYRPNFERLSGDRQKGKAARKGAPEAEAMTSSPGPC
jgi:uncharacterized protein YecE (DUF72 family)